MERIKTGRKKPFCPDKIKGSSRKIPERKSVGKSLNSLKISQKMHVFGGEKGLQETSSEYYKEISVPRGT